MTKIFSSLFLFSGCLAAYGQAGGGPVVEPPASFLDNDTYYTALSVGGGGGFDGVAGGASGQFMASAGLSTLLSRHGRGGAQDFVEAGVFGPLPDRSAPAGYVGFNLGVNHVFTPDAHNVFFATGGLGYVFGEAGAVNFGAGVDHFYRPCRAIRIEVREYFVFTERTQSNVAVRVGWVFGVHNP